MIALSTITKYRCPKCDQSYRVGQNEFAAGIFTAVGKIDNSKACHVCHSKLTIEHVMCKTISDIYGNRKYGFWICETHSNRRYYPNPMEAAMTNHAMQSYQGTGVQLISYYVEIAEEGFPWGCPVCDRKLEYRDERREGIQCST